MQKQEEVQKQLIPYQVNPQVDGRIQAGMINKLRLGHLQSSGHPVQET